MLADNLIFLRNIKGLTQEQDAEDDIPDEADAEDEAEDESVWSPDGRKEAGR